MNKKYLFILIGLINISEGTLGFLSGKIFIRHWHIVSYLESFIWFLSGLVLVYISTLMKNKTEHSKCPTCKESFNYSELKNGKCKYCDEKDTIEIDEYYKKYPEELKDI